MLPYSLLCRQGVSCNSQAATEGAVLTSAILVIYAIGIGQRSNIVGQSKKVATTKHFGSEKNSNAKINKDNPVIGIGAEYLSKMKSMADVIATRSVICHQNDWKMHSLQFVWHKEVPTSVDDKAWLLQGIYIEMKLWGYSQQSQSCIIKMGFAKVPSQREASFPILVSVITGMKITEKWW